MAVSSGANCAVEVDRRAVPANDPMVSGRGARGVGGGGARAEGGGRERSGGRGGAMGLQHPVA